MGSLGLRSVNSTARAGRLGGHGEVKRVKGHMGDNSIWHSYRYLGAQRTLLPSSIYVPAPARSSAHLSTHALLHASRCNDLGDTSLDLNSPSHRVHSHAAVTNESHVLEILKPLVPTLEVMGVGYTTGEHLHSRARKRHT